MLFLKLMFLKILQYSQKTPVLESLFSLQLHQKKYFNAGVAGVFLWILRNFKERLSFIEYFRWLATELCSVHNAHNDYLKVFLAALNSFMKEVPII